MQDAAHWEDTISHFIITRRYSKNSASVSTYILKSHIRWVLGQGLGPDSVTPAQIGRYLQELEGKGRSINTIGHHFGTVRRYYRWLVDQKLIAVDPTVDFQSPRVMMSVRDTFSASELAALWRAARTPYEKSVIGLLGINALKPDDLKNAVVTDLGRLEGYDILRLPKRTDAHGLPYTVLAPQVMDALLEVVDGRKSGPLLSRKGEPVSRKSLAWVTESVAQRAGITFKVSPLTLSFSMRAVAIEKGFSYTGVVRAAGDVETRRLVKWVHRAPTAIADHAALRMARLVIGTNSESLNLLMHARVLLLESDCPPAAAVGHAGAILERHLRELCRLKDVPVLTNNPKLGSYSASLAQQKIFTPSESQLVSRIQHYRDTAAHGWFDDLSQDDALWVLREIERLVNQFPLSVDPPSDPGTVDTPLLSR